MEYCNMSNCLLYLSSWILLSLITFSGLATCNRVEQPCLVDISDLTSQCLENYRNKVDHMRRRGHEFYTGVDVEEMRSICSAMRHGILCVSNAQRNCPDLADQIPAYPGEFIAVYNLCHADNFYEVYSMNQFCYAGIQTATVRCQQRFTTRTETELPGVENGDEQAASNYCTEFLELVKCVWAMVYSRCDTQAAEITEALVRAAVPHSGQCIFTQSTTQPPPTSPPSTARIYRYQDNDDVSNHGNTRSSSKKVVKQNANSAPLENSADCHRTLAKTSIVTVICLVLYIVCSITRR